LILWEKMTLTSPWKFNHRGSVEFAVNARTPVSDGLFTRRHAAYTERGRRAQIGNLSCERRRPMLDARCWFERDLSAMIDSRFTPVFWRNRRLWGLPRQRFDLVLNNFGRFAFTMRKIPRDERWDTVSSSGSYRRTFVCNSCALKAPREAVCGRGVQCRRRKPELLRYARLQAL